jgi:hypothetical protein
MDDNDLLMPIPAAIELFDLSGAWPPSLSPAGELVDQDCGYDCGADS